MKEKKLDRAKFKKEVDAAKEDIINKYLKKLDLHRDIDRVVLEQALLEMVIATLQAERNL